MNTFFLVLEILAIIFILIPTTIAFIFGAPFVPTPMDAVKKMINLAGVKKGERLYDLGCGDGRLVYYAANHCGADATGFELTPFVYWWAKLRQIFWHSKAKIRFRDFRGVNISDANIIVFYLLPEALARLKSKLEAELTPGSRVVSYAFAVPGWEPIHVEPRIPEKNISRILVYEIGKTEPQAQPK